MDFVIMFQHALVKGSLISTFLERCESTLSVNSEVREAHAILAKDRERSISPLHIWGGRSLSCIVGQNKAPIFGRDVLTLITRDRRQQLRQDIAEALAVRGRPLAIYPDG